MGGLQNSDEEVTFSDRTRVDPMRGELKSDRTASNLVRGSFEQGRKLRFRLFGTPRRGVPDRKEIALTSIHVALVAGVFVLAAAIIGPVTAHFLTLRADRKRLDP